MDIYITDMTTEHIPQVGKIEKESFSIPWSERAFEESLEYEYAVFKVAVDSVNERVTGYIGMYKSFEEGEITNIAVASEYRHNGIGKMLMDEMKKTAGEKEIKRILLEVRESNKNAMTLYEKSGFEKIGKRKNFYEKPREDALIMICHVLPL